MLLKNYQVNRKTTKFTNKDEYILGKLNFFDVNLDIYD